MQTAAESLVAFLAAHGVDRCFCVPGESYIAVLDALHDHPAIDLVTCRHEGGAGFMALADARLTGRPGVALVSRGPGACNAAIAMHTAQQDAVPLLLVVGQVEARDLRARAFQEIDYARMFAGIAKFVGEAVRPEQVPELLSRAWAAMLTGVPGPAVLSVPEDVLRAACTASVPAADTAPSAAGADRLAELLRAAERPIVIAGGDLDRPGGRAALLAFAEAWRVPVAVSFRRQDLFPNAHALYAGDMGLSNPPAQRAAFARADLVLALGTRLGDITTQGYSFPEPEQTLVHVCADPDWLGWRFPTSLAVAAHAIPTLQALAGRNAAAPPSRAAWIDALRALQSNEAVWAPRVAEDGVVFANIVAALGRRLPDDAIVTLDAGTFGAPFYRKVAWRPTQRLLAPVSGAMGYGMPAAVAAALRHPERPVICAVGDGGFLMTGSELAVAAARGAALKVLLSENGSYASIRIHQERAYPGRHSGTDLANPDLAAIGAAYGYPVMQVRTEDEVPALLDALTAPGPLFAVVRTSLSAVLPA
ncbi:thiamine pyrophosphate-binding protein [Limobrevibacterium gyesilva]|uniref:Thiamine pyrophosphate-binding protein n=1 Tax=Limobrevibacterium gyesilva TaxID=2991712 RepID=A0AA41YLC9_9PROT|nr:thiamine pyrophosphate-binding protein [Limobrevibacterium gyesilva]MCW3474382.1 thiamine pyrophosphate-binding protein [Limobrevibacterium gyesilva]